MKKILICVFFMTLLSLNLFSQDGNQVNRPLLAIADFNAINVPKSVAETVRETITNYIVRADKYKMVERSALKQVFQELNLQQSDLFDPGTIVKLGRLMAARGIIIGSVMKNGNNIVVQARLVDLQTGRIIRSSKAETKYEENMSRICAKVAYELINKEYSDSVVQGEVFLDFPYWKKTMIGLNIGIGLGRRLGKFDGYNDYDVISNEVKTVFQASVRLYSFFSKSSAFGIMFDIGWYTHRVHESGETIDLSSNNGVMYYTTLTAQYLYLALCPVIRFRDFNFYAGPYMNYLVKVNGRINTYQEFTTAPNMYPIEGKTSLFKNPYIGLTIGISYAFKNLPGNIKLLMGIEIKMTVSNPYNMDKVKDYINSSKTNTLDSMKLMSIYVNFGILFGL